MAEYFLVPHATGTLAPIPDAVSDEAAVYACDMLSTGSMGAEHCYLRLGDTAAVFAQGAVGLSATTGLTLLGASRIFGVESIPGQQALARTFGATDVVDYSEGDAVEQIMDATGGEGVDAAAWALGFPQTSEACLRVTKAGGRISNIGYQGEVPDPLPVPLEAFGPGMADKSMQRSLPGRRRPDAAPVRADGDRPLRSTLMTTHTFAFGDVVEAFRMMEHKEDGLIKPLITF